MNNHDKLNLVVKVFKALGDPMRMKLMRTLGTQFEEKATVNDLVNLFDISQPAISQHLKILKNMEMVNTEKKGYYMFYSINYPKIAEYKKFVDYIFELGLKKCENFPNCENCEEDCKDSG